MSGLAHFLEAEAIATVVIGLIPQHIAAMHPPRALNVPFALGRPLGAPDDPALQLSVLRAAMALLDDPGSVPIVAAFESSDVLPLAGNADEWSCPVSFPARSLGSPLVDRVAAEVRALMPWFERGRQSRGRTATGASGLDIEATYYWLSEFLTEHAPTVSPRSALPLGLSFKLAAEDLKAFYLEAGSAGPGRSSAEALNGWFWRETAAGELLIALRTHLADHADPGVRTHARFTLVPESEANRRRT